MPKRPPFQPGDLVQKKSLPQRRGHSNNTSCLQSNPHAIENAINRWLAEVLHEAKSAAKGGRPA